jgi:hypothetical protein
MGIVPDPDLNVLGPSRSFHQQAKNLRLNMISTVLRLLDDILSLKAYVYVPR